MLPLAILITSIPEMAKVQQERGNEGSLVAMTLITITVFIFWLVNIYLFTAKNKILKDKPYLKYILSFGFTLTFVWMLTVILGPYRNPVVTQFGLLRYYPFVGSTANTVLIVLLVNLFIGCLLYTSPSPRDA